MMKVPVWVVLQHDPVVVLRVGPDPGVRLTNSVFAVNCRPFSQDHLYR